MNRSDDADGGRGALRDHLPPIIPPGELQTRVRKTLRSRGHLGHPKHYRRWIGIVGLAAASFAAGLLVTEALESFNSSRAPVPRYALVLYGGLANEGTPVEQAARAAEYGRWAAGLKGDARFVDGYELGRVVTAIGPDDNTARNADPVAGFFMIDASSEEAANRIAQDCPHLKYGGTVIVRVIDS
ncbi:MAG TPA: YciI family protein [Gemmatimonadaceae bacterium]|nr:YciI family protein [Gemmatimonadaceae bacterium]